MVASLITFVVVVVTCWTATFVVWLNHLESQWERRKSPARRQRDLAENPPRLGDPDASPGRLRPRRWRLEPCDRLFCATCWAHWRRGRIWPHRRWHEVDHW